MVVAEIPGLAPDVLSRSAEHGALDRHPAVRRVIVPRRQETLDRQAEQHDPTVLAVEVPARHLVGRVERRDRSDLESDLLQLRPGAAEEFDGGAHGQVEPVESAVEGSERRPDDLAAPEAPVASVPRAAPRGCRSASGTAAGHDESLSGARARGAASAGPRPGAVLLR